jgi:hypothetical protein
MQQYFALDATSSTNVLVGRHFRVSAPVFPDESPRKLVRTVPKVSTRKRFIHAADFRSF